MQSCEPSSLQLLLAGQPGCIVLETRPSVRRLLREACQYFICSEASPRLRTPRHWVALQALKSPWAMPASVSGCRWGEVMSQLQLKKTAWEPKLFSGLSELFEQKDSWHTVLRVKQKRKVSLRLEEPSADAFLILKQCVSLPVRSYFLEINACLSFNNYYG